MRQLWLFSLSEAASFSAKSFSYDRNRRPVKSKRLSRTLLKQVLCRDSFYSKEILTQEEVLDQILEKWLSDKRGSKVIFAMPAYDKHQMMELARKNAQNVLAQDSEKLKREERRTTGAVHLN